MKILIFSILQICVFTKALDIIIISSVSNNLALDVEMGVSEGKPVVTWDKNDGKNQRWIIDTNAAIGEGPTVFQSLDQDGGPIKVLDEDTSTNQVAVWGSPGASNQQWFFRRVEDGVYFLVNEYTKRCAYNNGKGNRVTTRECNSEDQGQLWRLDILTEPKDTWQERDSEHRENVSRIFQDNDVSIYFDNDIPRSITWMHKFTGDVWRYCKQTYGNFGPNGRLFGIFHQNTFGGGHPGYFHRADHDNRNVIDVGRTRGSWEKAEGYNIDVIVHEIAHVVEYTCRGYEGSPARLIWGDSKWAEIFGYDVYKGIGIQDEADRIYLENMDKVDDYPNPGTKWFRNWFWPIYSNHGGTQVLVRFNEMLAQHFPKRGFQYQGRMNMGEFVHFWSGAARTNLKSIAEKAFNWTAQFETEFNDARAKFPGIIY